MIRASFRAFSDHVASLPGVPAVDEVVRLTPGGEAVRENYVVVWPPNVTALDDERYRAAQRFESAARLRFDVRPVATTADGAAFIADAVLSGVIGHVFDISGRSCDPARLVPGVEEGRTQYDRTARLHYVDFTFEVISRPL